MQHPEETQNHDDPSTWWIYLIETAGGQLYCGVTTDVARRYREHCSGGPRAARFLKGKGPLALRFSCVAGDRGAALRAECKVKKLSRGEKLKLIGHDEPVLARVGLSVT